MKLRAKCVPCLLNRAYYESALSTDDEALRMEAVHEANTIIQRALDEMARTNRQIPTVKLSSEVHRKVYAVLDDADPYCHLKEQSNEAALNVIPTAERLIDAADNRLRAAVLCAIVGNIMDFGVLGLNLTMDTLAADFVSLYNEGLSVDDTMRFERLLAPGADVVFLTDNCGEIVLDKLLCRELKTYGVQLTLVVKGGPILTDATMKEVEEIGFDDVVDNVMTTGCNAVGISMPDASQALKKKLETADLIIAKGMANYEALSETAYRPIAYLLRAKCDSVAGDLGVLRDTNIAKLFS